LLKERLIFFPPYSIPLQRFWEMKDDKVNQPKHARTIGIFMRGVFLFERRSAEFIE